MAKFKFFRDKGISDEQQRGVYDGQIWGLNFALQACTRIEQGSHTPEQIRSMIRDMLKELQRAQSGLPGPKI